MRGGRALALAEGAARDGAFGTATAPFALFPAFGGGGRAAAAFGGGGCFLLLAAVEAAAFDFGFVSSSSSCSCPSSSSFSSSPPPLPPPSSVFFWIPGQKAVVLPPTLIQRIPCPSCVAECALSSHRWWKIHSFGNSDESALAAQAVSATERSARARRATCCWESWPERVSGWMRAAKRTLGMRERERKSFFFFGKTKGKR